MASPRLGALLGAVALSGVVVVYVKVDRLAADVRPWLQARAERPAFEPADVREVEIGRAGPAGGAPVPAPAPQALPGKASAGIDPPGETADAGGTLEERVARLEARASKASHPAAGHWPMPRFVASVEDLARDLDLSAAQVARVEEAVRRGTQRIEDVLRIPDAEGRSPWDRRQERRRRIAEAAGKADKAALLEIGLAPLRERETRIPGRETTYGEEVDRIRDETRGEIESCLTEEQRAGFKDTRVDPLLGEETAVAFSVVATDGFPPPIGVIEVEEASPPPGK
jgi:hypothetical protein